MSYPKEPPKEHPSAYLIQDRENHEEMKRLEIQDNMTTAGMGGVLPELSDHPHLRRVLDVGCGTGGWLMQMARTYPTIEKLVGADRSSKVIAYARAQAKEQQLEDCVQFQTMDALRMLQFPANTFDLVNQRAAVSWLRSWEWKKILLEYQRVTRPGGIIRITEFGGVESKSPALSQLLDINVKAFHHSGRFFTPTHDGVTGELARLMTQHAIEDVQTKTHTLVFRSGTIEHHHFCEDIALWFRLGLPFYRQWTRVPPDYQDIYQRALKEVQAADFVATWQLVTAWGTKPMYGEPLLMRGLN